METAKRMGVKHSALKQKCLPKEHGMTAQSIGVAKGKCCWVHSDPYAGGKRSGKRAKPDVTSAAANARAHVCAVPLSTTAPTPSTPPEMLVAPSATVPTPSMHQEMQAPPSMFTFPSQPVPVLSAYTKSFTTTRTCMDVPQ